MPRKHVVILYCAFALGWVLYVQNVPAAAPNSSVPHSNVQENDQQFAPMVDRVHRLVNEFRAEHGRAALTLDSSISAAAREHSAEMARDRSAISHRGFKQRLSDIQKRFPFRAGAENVAMNAGQKDPATTAVDGWRRSPEHRLNMLGNFNLTGIGIASGENGEYFFTQIFIQTAKE
jgi:uncharacterized protein YkwD